MAFVIGALAFASGSAAQQQDARRRIFVEHGCTRCHGIWALGLKPVSDVGPDLTFAYGDVVTRYGMSLEAFLNNPSGVMRLMLASHLHLGAGARDSIATILNQLYQARRAEFDRDIPLLGDPANPVAGGRARSDVTGN
ncbi:MAG TPA: hypothetical protein VN848_13115 [Gemmatimonadales bacterium]|nr:hypothetical protein [Gemmatimonadales bacterium]